MQSGNLRVPIVVQRPKTASDEGVTVGDDGHVDLSNLDNWTTVVSRHSEMQEGAGREFEQARQKNADVSHVFIVRADSGTLTIGPEMRVTWTDGITNSSRVAEIESATAKRPGGGRRQNVVIAAKEVV